MEIIPAINAPTFEEVKDKIKKVEPYVNWCQLDITDGVFTKHLTWHDPRDLSSLETKLNVEVHLMIVNPEKAIDQWLVKPVKRVIVHLEAASDPYFIIERCRAAGVEVGLAISPETFWGKLEPWFGKVDLIQLLAVYPGPSGQQIQDEVFDKVIHIHKSCPECIIEMDGGITPKTVKKAAEYGAELFVAGSFIFKSPDIKKAIEELKNAAFKRRQN